LAKLFQMEPSETNWCKSIIATSPLRSLARCLLARVTSGSVSGSWSASWRRRVRSNSHETGRSTRRPLERAGCASRPPACGRPTRQTVEASAGGPLSRGAGGARVHAICLSLGGRLSALNPQLAALPAGRLLRAGRLVGGAGQQRAVDNRHIRPDARSNSERRASVWARLAARWSI